MILKWGFVSHHKSNLFYFTPVFPQLGCRRMMNYFLYVGLNILTPVVILNNLHILNARLGYSNG